MSNSIRAIFTLIVVAMLSSVVVAQGSWRVNRTKGNGDLISVFFTSESKGWIAGDDGYLAYTDNDGRTWRRKTLNTAANINEIYFRNSKNGYVVAGRKMFVTTDGGETWRDTLIIDRDKIGGGVADFLSIRFNSKSQGFIIGTILNDADEVIDSLLLRTVDGGKSWSRLTLPDVDTELFHLDFDGKREGWIVGDLGVVLATNDNGNSWTKQDTGITAGLYNVDFRDEKNGFAVGEQGTIIRTTDGGSTWEKVDSGVRNTLFRVHFVTDKEGWIVGSGGVILRTQDRGVTWTRQTSKTDKNLYGLFIEKKWGWGVGKGGLILKFDK